MLKKKEKYNIAIMGATGAVGSQFLSILEEKNLPIDELRLLASERSKGKKLKFNGEELTVQVLSKDSFEALAPSYFTQLRYDRSHYPLPPIPLEGEYVFHQDLAFSQHRQPALETLAHHIMIL